MSGKIYTLLPAIPYENLLAAAVFVAAATLCGVLITLSYFPHAGREG